VDNEGLVSRGRKGVKIVRERRNYEKMT